jgi:hypothetical protein
MAIQPIDAQVLFSRLNQMGKEQAEQKDGQMHAQVVQGAQIAKRTEEADHTVGESREAQGDDVRQVNDFSRRQRRQRKENSGGEGETGEQGGEDGLRRQPLREDYLGKKIDITG